MLFAQHALQQLERLVQADAALPTMLLLVAEWLNTSLKVILIAIFHASLFIDRIVCHLTQCVGAHNCPDKGRLRIFSLHPTHLQLWAFVSTWGGRSKIGEESQEGQMRTNPFPKI